MSGQYDVLCGELLQHFVYKHFFLSIGIRYASCDLDPLEQVLVKQYIR